jgi:hypothetical protein
MVEKGNEFSLILEDDATLSPVVNDKFLSEMIDLMKRNNLDILQIGFIERLYSKSLRSFAPGILEFLIALLRGRGTKDTSGFRFVLGEFRSSTHAYIVNNRLAEAISEISDGSPLIPWDDYLGSLAQFYMYGEIKIARLVKAVLSQESYLLEGSKPDSDIA